MKPMSLRITFSTGSVAEIAVWSIPDAIAMWLKTRGDRDLRPFDVRGVTLWTGTFNPRLIGELGWDGTVYGVVPDGYPQADRPVLGIAP